MELPGYRLISQLGERTWRARRLSDQALVAAKFLAGADPAELRRRAERQNAPAAGASRRDSSGMVRVEGVEEIPGGAAVVTPFVEGEPLSRALERGVRMELERAVLLARAVAESLAAGADKGMVHGALHPARIVIRGDEAFVLALGTGEELGGPRADGPHVYASPEVLSGKPLDCRADVYSLGAVLFQMLTGHPPFAQGSVGALKLAKTAELRWPRGSDENIPARVMRLVERMMAPEAEARHGDYDELLVGFEAATMKKRRSRRRVVLYDEEEPRSWLRGALIAAAMVILAAAVGLRALVPSRTVREEPSRAPPPVSAAAAPAAAEDEERAARRELEACAEAFDADPESAELLMPRLERLVGRKDDIGVDAELLRAKLRRRAGRKEAPEPRMAQKPEPPPEGAAPREESVHVRRRLNVAAEVALELAKLDPARARRLFEEAIAGLDLREYEEEVERIRAVLALAEEALAEEERRQKEEKRLERLREELPQAVVRAGHLAGAFRYAEAAAALKGFLDENPPPEEADFLRDYAGLIEREGKLFREVGRRYETGAEEGGLFFTENGEFLRIAGLGREGVTLVSDEMRQQGLKEMRMPWMHIGSSAIFDLFEEATDATQADERLALAVFAFHRGLAYECENGLTVAKVLDRGFAPQVERARAVLERAGKLRSPRRTRSE